MMKSYWAKPLDIERKWYVVDARDYVLGRLATEVAIRLMGKHKPQYTRSIDTGDHIIVINADKVQTTGNKLGKKIYYRHSGFMGGIKETKLEDLLAKKPQQVIELAVKNMLPKGKLGREMFSKLKVYAGEEHPHAAQQPEILKLSQKV